jgi:large subunit ribosomal protein L10
VKKETKVEFVTWLNAELSVAPALVAADYRGLTVAQITALRNQCREAGVRFKVAKNTLTRRAVEGTPLAKVTEFLEGPTVLAWHPEDPGAPARVLVEFLRDKKNEKMSIKGGVAAGKVLSAVAVREVLARLPNRQELLSTLAFIMTSAGAARLHRLMKSNVASMHRCLTALKEQRAGEAQ